MRDEDEWHIGYARRQPVFAEPQDWVIDQTEPGRFTISQRALGTLRLTPYRILSRDGRWVLESEDAREQQELLRLGSYGDPDVAMAGFLAWRRGHSQRVPLWR